MLLGTQKIISSLKRKKYLIISEDELEKLLSQSELMIEKDTLISDKIRLIKINNELIIQEKSTKNELLIRSVKSNKEAEEFIDQRLEIYDKMWDGCGCKVQYYD